MSINRNFMKRGDLWMCDECGFICNRAAVSRQHELMCPSKVTPDELTERRLTIKTRDEIYMWEGRNVEPKVRKLPKSKTQTSSSSNTTPLKDRTNTSRWINGQQLALPAVRHRSPTGPGPTTDPPLKKSNRGLMDWYVKKEQKMESKLDLLELPMTSSSTKLAVKTEIVQEIKPEIKTEVIEIDSE